MISQARLFSLMKREAVLSAAAALALLSMLWVPPDGAYLSYVDWRTMAQLFCLMAVMAGLRELGVFSRLGRQLLCRARSARQLECVLVFLCFFTSMAITNDVALLTFVPFSMEVLTLAGREERAVPVVVFQTVAANLGSMATPIGNPQNLYLYSKSGMKISDFLMLMLPYNVAALIFLTIWATVICHHNSTSVCSTNLIKRMPAQANQKIILLDVILFIVCLLVVVRVLPYGIAFAIVLICTLCADRTTLRDVDYSLLLTFVAFFVFIGNLGRIPAFSNWLQSILAGREVIVSVLASQVTSNVPAALLLSGFTVKTDALIIGTNLGGLGTLIASMASLISYRQIAREVPEDKSRYFKLFSASNLIFLAILLAEWWIIRQ